MQENKIMILDAEYDAQLIRVTLRYLIYGSHYDRIVAECQDLDVDLGCRQWYACIPAPSPT